MSNENWTKGPWEAKENTVGCMEVGPGDSPNNWRSEEYLCVTITTQECRRGYGAPIEKANAHLIAAAPDLYEALKDALCEMECSQSQNDYAMGKIRRAMEKARGEQQ